MHVLKSVELSAGVPLYIRRPRRHRAGQGRQCRCQDFQGRHYYGYMGKDADARERHRRHPAYRLAERFADEWDQVSFDPDYDTAPLGHFEPLVRRVFAAPRRLPG